MEIAMNHRAFGLNHLAALLLSCVSCAIGPLTHVGVAALPPPEYDVVILNGRVIDPETKLDAIRNIGINNRTIQAISATSMRGRTTVLATGLVVSPGFIDLHSHGQDEENYRYKAMDGVTTALELEVGVADVDRWYREREGKALGNYGARVGHISARRGGRRGPGTFVPG